jgi:hypothetical protein
MIITITPCAENGVPGDPFTLADGNTRTPELARPAGPSGLKIRRSHSMQVAEFFRSEVVGLFDRLNQRVEVSFSVTRTFTSVDAAQAYLLAVAAKAPTSGLVEFILENDSGGVPILWMPDADLTMIEGGENVGMTVRHNYTLTAPAILTQLVSTS